MRAVRLQRGGGQGCRDEGPLRSTQTTRPCSCAVATSPSRGPKCAASACARIRSFSSRLYGLVSARGAPSPGPSVTDPGYRRSAMSAAAPSTDVGLP